MSGDLQNHKGLKSCAPNMVSLIPGMTCDVRGGRYFDLGRKYLRQ